MTKIVNGENLRFMSTTDPKVASSILTEKNFLY